MIMVGLDHDDQISHRCNNCHKLLAVQTPERFGFEVKCLRCGQVNLIFQSMKDQVIITDKTGKIVFVNSEVERLTGYSIGEVIGKTPALWGGQMSKEFYQELWRLISVEKRSIIAKLTNKNRKGELYDVLLRISPVLNIAGDVVFFVGIETPFDEKYFDSSKDWSMPRID